MDKRYIAIGLLLAIVLLSGCIQVSIKEEVLADGKSNITMRMDMSNFPGTGEETQNPCENMTQSQETPLTNVQCNYADKVLTLTGQMDRKAAGGLTIDGESYRLDVKQAIQAMSSDPSSGQELPEDSAQLQQLKAAGVKYDYYVKLPGAMTKQEGGEVQSDGFVKFDILALPDTAYVESTTSGGLFGLDMFTLMAAAGVVVVVLLIVVVILLKR